MEESTAGETFDVLFDVWIEHPDDVMNGRVTQMWAPDAYAARVLASEHHPDFNVVKVAQHR